MKDLRQETIESIRKIINEAEAMKNAYFFQSPGNAGARRSYEKKHSWPRVIWMDGKDMYTAEYHVSCSCSNVYAAGIYTKNGKKTTLLAIKNSLKRLEAQA